MVGGFCLKDGLIWFKYFGGFKNFSFLRIFGFGQLFSKAKIFSTSSSTIKIPKYFFLPLQVLPLKSCTPSVIFFNSSPLHKNILSIYILNSKKGIWINHSFLTFTKELYFLWLFCLHQNYPYIYMVPSTHFSKNIWSYSSNISNFVHFKFGPEIMFWPQTISKPHQKFLSFW